MEKKELKSSLKDIETRLRALQKAPDGDPEKRAFRRHCKEMIDAFTEVCGGEVVVPDCDEHLPQDSALARDILKLAGETGLGAAMDAETMAKFRAILSLLQDLCACKLKQELALKPYQKQENEEKLSR